MMVDLYLQDVDSYVLALSSALEAADSVTLSREAHTVKGLLATFSDDAGAAAAAKVEHLAAQGMVADQAAAVAGLLERMRQVADALRTG